MIYLTYSDQPSGVFSSQVNDVCNFLNKELNAGVKLVAFISLHAFRENRRKIRNEVPGALVLPAIPKATYWQFSSLVFLFICLFTGQRNVIARNVIAAKIALNAKKTGVVRKVVLDGRGAIAAEWNEYEVVPVEQMKQQIRKQEEDVVLQSDFRIAVSSRLVDYWRSWYGYNGSEHVIIPCTLNSGFQSGLFSDEEIAAEREKLGFGANDVVMVYSGSTAGWQSFRTLAIILGNVLQNSKGNKLLFLSLEDENIKAMKSQYPGQVFCRWVNHKDVQRVLSACDYGILYRENSVTNQVASPTKFAEYLSAGLPVIISENLGDYSEFVTAERCGMVVKEGDTIHIEKTPVSEKKRMTELATRHFTKTANKNNYKTLINFLNKD